MNDEQSLDREAIARSLEAVRQLVGSARLSIILVVFGCAVVLGSFVYSITQLRPLEDQVQQLETRAARAVAARDIALSETTAAQTRLAEARAERQRLVAEIAMLSKQRNELQQLGETSEASAEANKLKAAALPVDSAEIQLAEIDVTPAERERINRLVADLFSESGNARTTAYRDLTTKLRTKTYAVDKILERGNEELARPHDRRDFVGLYHTIVTLTDMSRAATQKTETKKRIDAYADRVAKAFPQLERRVDTLKAWLESVRR